MLILLRTDANFYDCAIIITSLLDHKFNCWVLFNEVYHVRLFNETNETVQVGVALVL